jgi:hypothetical protein
MAVFAVEFPQCGSKNFPRCVSNLSKKHILRCLPKLGKHIAVELLRTSFEYAAIR